MLDSRQTFMLLYASHAFDPLDLDVSFGFTKLLEYFLIG